MIRNLPEKKNQQKSHFVSTLHGCGCLSLHLPQTRKVFVVNSPSETEMKKMQFKNQTSEGWGKSGRGNGRKITIKTATWPVWFISPSWKVWITDKQDI